MILGCNSELMLLASSGIEKKKMLTKIALISLYVGKSGKPYSRSSLHLLSHAYPWRYSTDRATASASDIMAAAHPGFDRFLLLRLIGHWPGKGYLERKYSY